MQSSKMTFSAKTQTHENLSQVFLEALRSDFVHLSSKMTFSAKKLKLMKCCLLHCKNSSFSLERILFHVVELALKIALATFSD